MVALGGFFVVNLFLAVIFLELSATRHHIAANEAASALPPAPAIPAPAIPASAHAAVGGSGQTGGGSGCGSGSGSGSVGGGGGGGGDEDDDARRLLLAEQGGERSDGVRSLAPAAAADGAESGGPGTRTGVLAAIATSSWLTGAATLLVLSYLVLACMPYEGMPPAYKATLERAAEAITWAFIVEMTLKLLGLGWRGYWSDGWNMLDGAIVSISIFEMALTALLGDVVDLSTLRLLRMLRIMRILRLMRSWRGLYNIVSTFVRAAPQIGNLASLIVLFVFMSALLGMQLFGGLYRPQTGYDLQPCPGGTCADPALIEKPRLHFDYCMPAMITVLVLLTGEWAEAAETSSTQQGPLASTFFIIVVLVGKLLLMNLLIAIILTEFAEMGDGDSAGAAALPDKGGGSAAEPRDSEAERGAEGGAERGAEGGADGNDGGNDGGADGAPPPSGLRVVCRQLITQPWFDWAILVAIVASFFCLMLDTPRVVPGSVMAHLLQQLDTFFIVVRAGPTAGKRGRGEGAMA